MRVLLLMLLAACSPPSDPLGPSQALLDDDMAKALQPDATLVVGFDGDPALRDWADVDPDGVLARIGLVPESIDAWRVGCGASGCAVLLEGDLSGVAWDAAPRELKGVAPRIRTARGAVPGVDVRDPYGDRFAVRQLAPHKAVAGDVAAITELARLAGARHAGSDRVLDVAALQRATPAGGLWMAARDPERLVAQARTRLQHRPDAATVLDLLERATEHPDIVERVQAAGLSLSLEGDRLRVASRVVCTDERGARLAERGARHLVEHPPESLAWLARAEQVVVAREGVVTEVRVDLPREVLP